MGVPGLYVSAKNMPRVEIGAMTYIMTDAAGGTS